MSEEVVEYEPQFSLTAVQRGDKFFVHLVQLCSETSFGLKPGSLIIYGPFFSEAEARQAQEAIAHDVGNRLALFVGFCCMLLVKELEIINVH